MPVRERDFSRTQLWPKSTHNWMHPTAAQGLAHYPPGVDLGALRVRDGWWEIYYSTGWIYFDPLNHAQMYAANAFNRVGRGWSFGPAHGMHDEVRGYFQDVYGRNPTDMEKLDIEHDKAMWQELQAKWKAIFVPSPPPTPPPLPPPPQPPPVPPTTPPAQPALSTPEHRAAELLSLLPEILRLPWILPLLTELVRASRRSEDRVVARVAEEIRKGRM